VAAFASLQFVATGLKWILATSVILVRAAPAAGEA
jgi:hypothetical protein